MAVFVVHSPETIDHSSVLERKKSKFYLFFQLLVILRFMEECYLATSCEMNVKTSCGHRLIFLI